MKRFALASLIAILAFGVHPVVRVDAGESSASSFRPVARFMVPNRNSAEIVAATPDGEMLVYSDAVGRTVGIVDISDPAAPVQTATVPIAGTPTSVAVTPDGLSVVIAVKTQAYAANQLLTGLPAPSVGQLWKISLADPLAVPAIYPIATGPDGAIGYLPDSVALTQVGAELYAVVALENEPIVVRQVGATLQYLGPEPAGVSACPTLAPFMSGATAYNGCDLSSPGFVQIVRVTPGGMQFVSNVPFPASAMDGLLYAADPQPEFVTARDHRVAVTLQENNGFAVLDLTDPHAPTREIFNAGVVADKRADLLDNDAIDFSQTYPGAALVTQAAAGTRVPDGIAWDAEGTQVFVANEGEFDLTGGRGFSAFSSNGSLIWDDEGQLERSAVERGYYPDSRSDAKGIETEGIATGLFGNKEFVFVTSERGAFVAVYRVVGWGQPKFVQILPTGLRPEAALAIPSRGLFVTADEGNAGDGSISIFASVRGEWDGTADEPLLQSASVDEPWSALSGFAAHPVLNQRLFSVPDNALPSSIFQIDVVGSRAKVSEFAKITVAGGQARYDLEGIAVDTSMDAPSSGAGFWLASEGNASCSAATFQPNLLVQVNARGEMLQEVRLPGAIEPGATAGCSGSAPAGAITSNGFEGLAVTPGGRYLLVAIQRPFKGEATASGATHTRIGRYDLQTDTWEFFAYPVRVSPTDTIGLSEITLMGYDRAGREVWGVIERDNRYGLQASWKRVYTFTLPAQSCAAGQTVAQCVGAGALVEKTLFEDLLDDYFPLEKVESLVVTRTGDVWTALDNDGGEIEPRMVRIRRGRR